MSEKGDKSLEDLESSQCNYTKGGLMFCLSPPLRNNTRSKGKSDNPGDGSNNSLKGPVKDRIIRKKDVHAEKQQNKPDRPREEKSKGEAFCISPPVPKKSALNKNLSKDVKTPQIIEKLRNGRINAFQNSERQPVKADHSISNGQHGNRISSSSIPGHTNDTKYVKIEYISEGHTNDRQVQGTPDQSTGDLRGPPNDYNRDGTNRDSTSGSNEKANSIDEITQTSTITTELQDENEQERKDALARFLQGWTKLFAQNRSEIQKLREQVKKAKEGISQICEEEENWKCRLEMQKGVVNASLKKIEHVKERNPFWYSGAYGTEPTMEQLKSNLRESREDLVYQLSRVQKVTQEAVNEKVMERRQLGESYPKWLLPNFRKAYSKYSNKHLSNESLIQSVCPKLDIIVPFQKRPDNSRRFYKVLIDGRYFNYKKTGLTQVMGLVNEEMNRNGKLELNIPIKTTSNDAEIKITCRKPQNTHAIDVEFIQANGCDESTISCVDKWISNMLEFSTPPKTIAGDKIACFNGKYEVLTNESTPLHIPHPPSSPNTTTLRPDKLMTQKAQENTAREYKTKDRSSSHSVDGAREVATYTSPLITASRQSKSMGYVLLFDKSTSPQQQMRIEQLCDHKPGEGEEYSSFGDAKSKNIVTSIAAKRSKANTQKCDLPRDINQMDTVDDRKVKDVKNRGPSRSLDRKKHNDLDESHSWKHGHSVLPTIGPSMENQTMEGESTKYEINTLLGDQKVSVQCEADVIPVKVPHRTPLFHVVTYVLALVRKDTIRPLSLARQGSFLPIRQSRFNASYPKHVIQKHIEGRDREEVYNVKGTQKRGLSRSLAKTKCYDTIENRSWQLRHSVLPPIGESVELQGAETECKSRVTNMKLDDNMVSIVCKTNMIPVKVLHRTPTSNNITHVITLVRKDSITPFSLKRQASFIPIRPQYAKQDILELRLREQNRAIMYNVQNRRLLYTIQERSHEFDDENLESPKHQEPLPFASYQDEQLNSPLGSYQQEEINIHSAAMEYEIFSSQDSSYGHEDHSMDIQREASIVSLGFTPGGNVDDDFGVDTEKREMEDEKTSGKEFKTLEKDEEELITDWSRFFSTRNSNVNCCGYRGPSLPAYTGGSSYSKVLVSLHTSSKKPAIVSSSRRHQILVPHPPSTKRPATATNSRRSFVKVRALF